MGESGHPVYFFKSLESENETDSAHVDIIHLFARIALSGSVALNVSNGDPNAPKIAQMRPKSPKIVPNAPKMRQKSPNIGPYLGKNVCLCR
jgi:hypothetical protein